MSGDSVSVNRALAIIIYMQAYDIVTLWSQGHLGARPHNKAHSLRRTRIGYCTVNSRFNLLHEKISSGCTAPLLVRVS